MKRNKITKILNYEIGILGLFIILIYIIGFGIWTIAFAKEKFTIYKTECRDEINENVFRARLGCEEGCVNLFNQSEYYCISECKSLFQRKFNETKRVCEQKEVDTLKFHKSDIIQLRTTNKSSFTTQLTKEWLDKNCNSYEYFKEDPRYEEDVLYYYECGDYTIEVKD